MKRGFEIAVRAALCIAAFGATVPGARAQAVSAAGEGRALYIKKGCYECHGLVGQGSIMSGSALAPSPISVQAMTAYVRMPKGQMPIYSEHILPTADIERIHAYLASLPRARPPETIDMLRVDLSGSRVIGNSVPELTHGKALFANHCASCHGERGEGAVAPSLLGIAKRSQISGIEAFIRKPSGASLLSIRPS